MSFIICRLFHRNCLYRMGNITLDKFRIYQKDRRMDKFIELAMSALSEMQQHIKLYCETIYQNLSINEVFVNKEITSNLILKLIDEEELTTTIDDDKTMITLLEYIPIDRYCKELIELQNSLDEMVTIPDPAKYAEYLFFGDFETLPLTEFHSIRIPPSNSEITLESISSNGKVKSFAISDVGQLLQNIFTENRYHPVDLLESLIQSTAANRHRKIKLAPNKTFFPYLNSDHYTLFVLNLNDKEKAKLYWYNSKKDFPINMTLEQVHQVLRTQWPQIPEEVEFFQPLSPQQLNGVDCGVHTILNMIHTLTGERDGEIFYDENINYRPIICQSLEASEIDPQLIRLLSKVCEIFIVSIVLYIYL